MGKPLSIDLRVRIARDVAAGGSCRAAAERFHVAPSSAIRLMARYRESGDLAPRRQGGDRRSKLKAHREFILCRVKGVPDITLAELAAELAERGVLIHPSNLSRFLRAENLTYKKNAGGRRAATGGRAPEAPGVDRPAPADHAPAKPSPGVSR